MCLKKLSRNNISFRKDTEKKYAITSEKLEINSGLKKKMHNCIMHHKLS